MARVTVEDCVVHIPNRFDLVLYTAQRARNIARGSRIAVPRDNDKNPVVALREIAQQLVEIQSLHDDIVRGLQKVAPPEEAEEEVVSAMSTGSSWKSQKKSGVSLLPDDFLKTPVFEDIADGVIHEEEKQPFA